MLLWQVPRTAGVGAWYLVGSVPALALTEWIPPMVEPHLFRVPAGYQATFRLERDGTWTLVLDRFYEGEMWSIYDREVYHELSLAEASETLLSELSSLRL